MPELYTATHWMNRKVARESLIGAPTLIHFWSVSCPKCKQALPVIQSIRDQYSDQLHVVAIHMPLSNDDLNVQKVARAAEYYAITEPILIDNTHRLADSFGTRFVPAYFLFDPYGHLLEYHMGERGALRIEKAVNRLFFQNH